MAYQGTYKQTFPLEPGGDVEALRWLMRESFERKAAAEYVRIVEYREEQVGSDTIPPVNQEWLPLPIDQYQWWHFEADVTTDESRIAALAKSV